MSKNTILRSVEEPLDFYGIYFAKITVECPEFRDLSCALGYSLLGSTYRLEVGAPPKGTVRNFKSSEYEARSLIAYSF